MSGDSLVAVLDAYTGSGRIFRILEDGPHEAGAFDLGWSPLPVDQPREVRAAQRRASEIHGESPDDWEVVVPEYYAQSGDVHLADGGRLWVHHDPELGGGVAPEREVWFRRDQPQRWHVLSWRSGRVLATVELPGGFRVHEVTGRRVVGIHYDELDVQTVRVYRIPAIPGA